MGGGHHQIYGIWHEARFVKLYIYQARLQTMQTTQTTDKKSNGWVRFVDNKIKPWDLCPGSFQNSGRTFNISPQVAGQMNKAFPAWFFALSVLNESHCSELTLELSGTRTDWGEEQAREDTVLVFLVEVITEPSVSEVLSMREHYLIDRVKFVIELKGQMDTFSSVQGIKYRHYGLNWSEMSSRVMEGFRKEDQRGQSEGRIRFVLCGTGKIEKKTEQSELFFGLASEFCVDAVVAEQIVAKFGSWRKFGEEVQEIYHREESFNTVCALMTVLGLHHGEAVQVVKHMLQCKYLVQAETEDFNESDDDEFCSEHARILYSRYTGQRMVVMGSTDSDDMVDID